MTIKVKIKKDSGAEKALKSLANRQKQFREAVQSGKLEDYTKKHAFAHPVFVSKP